MTTLQPIPDEISTPVEMIVVFWIDWILRTHPVFAFVSLVVLAVLICVIVRLIVE